MFNIINSFITLKREYFIDKWVIFYNLFSLLRAGMFPDIIKFCFDVYLEMLRMSTYIRRDDVLLMAQRNSLKFCKLINTEEFDTNFVTFIMTQMDKDRDDRISYEDYRTSVLENVTRLQFLGQVRSRTFVG